MPKGYSAVTGMPVGNAVRRTFAGMERTCQACQHVYAITEAMVRRKSYKCPRCESKRAVENARKNREAKRASNNAWHAKNSDKRAERTRAYRARHPEAKAAHQAVQSALRNGSLKRLPCEVCGAAQVHGHHDDYSKPLHVIWLCHRHHMERHAMLAAREGES